MMLPATDRCEQPMRDGTCQMDAGHRGRHTTVAYYCDYCGKTRRSVETFFERQSDGYDEPVADVCFMCKHDIDGSQRRHEEQAYDEMMRAVR